MGTRPPLVFFCSPLSSSFFYQDGDDASKHRGIISSLDSADFIAINKQVILEVKMMQHNGKKVPRLSLTAVCGAVSFEAESQHINDTPMRPCQKNLVYGTRLDNKIYRPLP